MLNYVNVPIEVLGIILLLAQVVNYVVIKGGIKRVQGLTEEERRWLQTIYDGQRDHAKLLDEISKTQWRTAQILQDIKEDIRECPKVKAS